MVETETATLWHIINTHCFASQTHEMLKSNRPCSVAIFLLSEKDAVSTCLCSSVLFRSRGFLLLRTQPLPAGLRGGECVCVCVCGWVSLCGCGCVSQKAVHTTNTFHCIHTLPTSVNSVFTHSTIVKLVRSLSFVVSIPTHRVESLHISHSQWLTSDRAIYLPASYTSVAPAKR